MEENTKILSMDEFLGVDDVNYVTVPLPGGKGSVRFGSLDAGYMLEFLENNEDKKARSMAGLRLIRDSMVDEKGKRIGEDKHLAGLKKKNAQFINKLVGEILKLNGIGQPEEKAGNVSSEVVTAASLTA